MEINKPWFRLFPLPETQNYSVFIQGYRNPVEAYHTFIVVLHNHFLM